MNNNINTTYAQLLQYHHDIHQFNGTILNVFFREKIKQFYNHNGVRIQSVLDKQRTLMFEFFETEGPEGKETFRKDAEGKRIYKEGKTQFEFDARLKEFLNTQTPITL
jgi:hypothetical protein